VRNVQGMTASLSSIMDRASNMGLPNSFGAVMAYPGMVAQMGNQSSQVVSGVVRSTFTTVARVGDMGSLSSMASSMGIGGIASIIPNPVNTVARNFNMPPASKLSDYEQACQVAQSSFSEMEPGWDTAKVGSATLPSVTGLLNATRDFTRMINVGAVLSSNPLQKLQLVASAVPNLGNAMSSITRNFPQTVIRNTVNLGTVDPRVLDTAVPSVNRQALQAGVTDFETPDVNRQALQEGTARTSTDYGEDSGADLLMSNVTPGYAPINPADVILF
jgi:hypothetical protein